MNNKIIKILKYLIGWPLSAVSLFFVFKLIFSNLDLLTALKNINIIFLIFGLTSFLAYFFLRTYLWQSLIQPFGNKFNFFKSSYLWEISEIKRYTPGNIWSFLSRAKLFSENNITQKQVAESLFNEIILIILSCLTLSYFYVVTFLQNSFLSTCFLVINFLLVLIYLLNHRIKLKFFPKNSFWSNFKLYSISLLSFFFFGLATYFTTVSIVYLDPKNILNLVSLFVFALLVGYLSIITPMGLGVREGVTTLGLSREMSLPTAGLISVFTRIIFIISEIIFLSLIYLLNKLKNEYLDFLISFFNKNKQLIILSVCTLIFFLYFTTAGFLRYDNFYTGRFDLGNMDQTVWNTINGRIFQITDANGTETVSRLAFHADFILILISPIYFIWANPKMLILLQVIIMSLAPFILFFLSKDITKNKNFSLAISICFLLYPAVNFNLLYDFHGATLATTFLLFTYYFYLKQKYLWFLVFAFLSGISKEQLWAVVAIFGAAIAFLEIYKHKLKLTKKFLFGLIIFILGSLLFYGLIWKIIPLVRGESHFALAYFSNFGKTPSEVFINIFLNPVNTLSVIFKPENLTYFNQLFAPLGFLSFFALPILIFILPDFLINTLSSNPQLHQIYYQYTAALIPFIFISAIYGAKFITGKFKFLTFGFLSLLILLTSLYMQYVTGPLPGSKRASLDMFSKQLSNAGKIEQFLKEIPKTQSVAATNNLGSHLSRRQDIYTIPIGIEKADVVLFLFNNGYSQLSPNTLQQLAIQIKNDKKHILVYKTDNFIVFKKVK